MKKEYTEKLCKDYPEIFQLDPPQTTVHTPFHLFEFECDNGWYPLINSLCKNLMNKANQLRRKIQYFEKQFEKQDSEWSEWQKDHYTQEKYEQLKLDLKHELEQIPRATQVKEKFGSLSFYYSGGNQQHTGMIDFAEQLSYTICEKCGSMFAQTYTIGWHRTLCDQHADEAYGKQLAENFRNSR